MEKINRKIIGIMIFVAIVLGVCFYSYAENETGNTAVEASNTSGNVANTTQNNTTNNTAAKENTTNNKGTQETQKKETTTVTKTTKSSNANLSNLGIKPNDFKGFKADVTTYDINVPKDVASVEIYASVQDKKSSVTGTGKKELKYGLNEFEVVVTAEDGTKKTYTLNIKREEYVENTENVPDRYTGEGLASLNINDLELSPKFDTIVYEYTVKYIGEEEKLNITATATDPYYSIDIVGNDKLVEGENIVNILVSDPDGNNIAVYQITVNKSLVDEEAIAREEAEKTRNIFIMGGIILVIVVILIVSIIIKKRKNKKSEDLKNNYDEEENYSPYIDIDYEDDKKENNQLEDFDEDMNYVAKEELESIEKKAREEFLNNYNNDSEEEMEKEQKNKKNKGKRFK